MQALKLKPVLKNYIWGGDVLSREWGKGDGRIAESWELSCHADGLSVVEGGEYDGKTLAEVLKLNPDYLGVEAGKFEFFPILIKLIDAGGNLSVQVHPDDEYALTHEGQYGKTEIWYVVDAKEGAGVYCGFKRELSRDELAVELKGGDVTRLLNFIEVKKGDCIFIPAGTVHAICGGLVICEVQQNSSLTYRLYDYGRLDGGKPRPLHIDKALDVANLTRVCRVNESVGKREGAWQRLAQCRYFDVSLCRLAGKEEFYVDADSFVSLTAVEGAATLASCGNKLQMRRGDTVFLPAGGGKATLEGVATLVAVRV